MDKDTIQPRENDLLSVCVNVATTAILTGVLTDIVLPMDAYTQMILRRNE